MDSLWQILLFFSHYNHMYTILRLGTWESTLIYFACMCICVLCYTCLCAGKCAHGHACVKDGVHSLIPLFFVLRQGISRNLECTALGTGPAIHLSPPSQLRDHGSRPACPAGDLNSDPRANAANISPTESSLQQRFLFPSSK